ncbi:hypothetical protein [Prolixibacter sp. SD074]|jgi:hypothetical protein|uniref:hypothetical protein n=1 Tax=Prolixibacter sp. SD074 TaxID=2652391 RepID=UPI00128548AB|nr:hypothetical protein [Prolixibacter sp. SD074]GET30382.1 hypothetical protein SD074_25840 [Prolixibacter sp. SD074]
MLKSKPILLLFLFLASISRAQAAPTFLYQAQLTDDNGTLVTNQNVNCKIELIRGENSSETLYQEYQELTTSATGMLEILVGNGTDTIGSLTDIDWQSGKIFIRLSVDLPDGNGFHLFKEQPINAVPYALMAGSAKPGWKLENNRLSYTAGNVGIGTDNPEEALDFGVNKAIRFKTTLTHLNESAMVKLKWKTDSAKPAIMWVDENDNPRAALYTYQLGVNGEPDSIFCIATSDSNGKLVPRFNIPWGHDNVELSTTNSNFKVAGSNKFIVGTSGSPGQTAFNGNVYIGAGKKLGIGDKDWENTGVDEYAEMEIYQETKNAQLLLNQAAGNAPAAILLRKGNNTWKIENNDDLHFSYNGQDIVTMTQEGNMGIGTVSPTEKVDVAGNIKVTEGNSFRSGNSGTASYMAITGDCPAGNLVGLNPATGELRDYQTGDEFIGIATDKAAFISNETKTTGEILIGTHGQFAVNTTAIQTDGHKALTPDGKLIGYILSNGNLFIR